MVYSMRLLLVITITSNLLTSTSLAKASGVSVFEAENISAEQLKTKMLQAYESTQTYLSRETSYSLYKDSGNRSGAGSRTLFAYNRNINSIRCESTYISYLPDGAIVEKPGCIVVSNGQTLWHRDTRQPPGRHVEVKISQPITYPWLVLIATPFDGWTHPYLYLLLGEDLIDVIERISMHPDALQLEAVQPRSQDTRQRPGLKVVGFCPKSRWWGTTTITFWLDPKTYLITQITCEDSSEEYIGIMDIDILLHNEPLKPKLFTFEANNSKPFRSRRELVGRKHHPLLGEPAPQFTLNTMNNKEFRLSDAKGKVVILDFWATWCAPCVDKLPELQMLHEWVQKHNKSVAIYSINVEETPDQIQKLWERLELTMPVLMDKKAKVKEMYQAKGLPSMFVIYENKIVYALPGDFKKLKLIVDHFLQLDKVEPIWTPFP